MSGECIWIPDPRAEAYQTACGDLIGTTDRSWEAEDRLTCPHCLKPVRFEDRPFTRIIGAMPDLDEPGP